VILPSRVALSNCNGADDLTLPSRTVADARIELAAHELLQYLDRKSA
jgi:hypothetical protein